MINLLPPEFKTQKRYAIYNILALRYTLVIMATAATAIAILITTQFLANQQLDNLNADLADKERIINTKADVLKEGQTVDNQLEIAASLIDKEYQFSALLNDISSALPNSARIMSIKLDGDDKIPLALRLEVKSRNNVTEVQQALQKSQRFTHVDIQSIVRSETGVTAEVRLGYTPGAAR